MPALIAFRLIQGLGAGAIQPVSITVIGDLYATHERGKFGWQRRAAVEAWGWVPIV